MTVGFWSNHQVGGPYKDVFDSEQALILRAELFPDLERLMPTVIDPYETVLDYGCGPGHDTILFCENGAACVYYTDTSPLAIQYTQERLRFHEIGQDAAWNVQPWRLVYVHRVHCAGVLHHTDDAPEILKHFRRCLIPDGFAQVMVYDGSMSEHSQSEVPVTHWWTHDEFICMAENAGFEAEYVGSYECSAVWRPNCWAACYRLT